MQSANTDAGWACCMCLSQPAPASTLGRCTVQMPLNAPQCAPDASSSLLEPRLLASLSFPFPSVRLVEMWLRLDAQGLTHTAQLFSLILCSPLTPHTKHQRNTRPMCTSCSAKAIAALNGGAARTKHNTTHASLGRTLPHAAPRTHAAA